MKFTNCKKGIYLGANKWKGGYACGDWLIVEEAEEWIVYFVYQRVGAFDTKRAAETFCERF